MKNYYDKVLLAVDIELLKLSMFKWMNIVFKGGVDHGTEDCSLCGAYYNDPYSHENYGDIIYEDRCNGCPIKESVGTAGCHSTPYDEWYGDRVCDLVNRKAALDMVHFLADLRYNLIKKMKDL